MSGDMSAGATYICNLYHARDGEDPSDYEHAEERYRWGLSRCDTEADVIRDRLEWLEKERTGQGAT